MIDPKERADLLAKIRQFFATRNILEVETPYFYQTPPANPGIVAFMVKGTERDYYLLVDRLLVESKQISTSKSRVGDNNHYNHQETYSPYFERGSGKTV